jgi:hypothetical protein
MPPQPKKMKSNASIQKRRLSSHAGWSYQNEIKSPACGSTVFPAVTHLVGTAIGIADSARPAAL